MYRNVCFEEVQAYVNEFKQFTWCDTFHAENAINNLTKGNLFYIHSFVIVANKIRQK